MAKTSLKPKKLYRCTQSELYAICLLIWASCKKHIADFVLLKAYYTLTYVANQITAVLMANNIPDAPNRINIAERLRNDMVEMADECCGIWQRLRVYIVFRYGSDSSIATWLQDAGEDFYNKAANYNWEFVAQLMKNGSKFIADHLTELQAGGNMPTTFQAEFDGLKTNAVLLYMQFQEAMDNAEEVTTQKINANNEIYKQVMLLCKDGQQIYRKNAANKEEFTFSKVLDRVRGTSSPYQEFEVPVNNTIKIKKLMANSPFMNTGETELVVCIGDVSCTPGTGTTVAVNGIIILAEGVDTITVLNQNSSIKGKCKVRVIKK